MSRRIMSLNLIIRLSAIVYFFLLYEGVTCQQNFIQLKYINQSADVILNEVAAKIEGRFNYTNHTIPQGKFTFSFKGSPSDALQVVQNILNIELILLDEGEYALSKSTSKVKLPPAYIGTVVDQYGEPLIGCNIYISSLEIGTTTDATGRFTIEGYFDQDEQLEISYLGFQSKTIKLSGLGQGVIVLQQSAHSLGDIIITGKIFEDPIDGVDHLNLEGIPQVGQADKDVFTMSQSLTGVYNSSESLYDLQIRGGTPDQVGYRWNDIPIFQNSLFYGRISSVNPFMVDQVTISRNGTAAGTSSQASGLINMTSDLRDTSKIFGLIHADLLYSNIGLGFSLFKNKWRTRIAFRTSMSDIVNSPINQAYLDNTFQFGILDDDRFYIEEFDLSDYVELERQFSFDDFSLSSVLDIDDKTTIRLNVVSFANQFSYEWKEPDFGRLNTLDMQSYGGSMTVSRQWSKTFDSRLITSTSIFDRKYHFTSQYFNNETQINQLQQESYKLDNDYKWNDNYTLNFGYEHIGNTMEFIDTSEDLSKVGEYIDNQSATNTLYAQLRATPVDWIQLSGGLRWTKYNKVLLDRAIIEPRIHISLIPYDGWNIHLHYGEFHQTVNRRNSFTALQADNGYYFIADESSFTDQFLYIVQNRQFSGGVRYRKGNWTLNLDAYRKNMLNIWTSSFDFYYAEDPYKYADLKVTGVESSIQFANGWLYCNIGYDYVDDLVIQKESNLSFRSPYSQPHRLNLMTSVSIKGLQIGGQVRYASGRFYSNVDELVNTTGANGEQEITLLYESLLGSQVDDYLNIDLSAKYSITYNQKTNKKISVGAHCTNILNRKNIIKNLYYIDYKTAPINSALFQRKGLPFTFNISVDINF